MTPVEASDKRNEGTVYFNLYGGTETLKQKPKFKIGDKVRISKYKRKVFDKGYTPNWTEEVFTVDKIQYTHPITYKLKDLNDEEIQGSFYEPELLKARQDVFRIDKVIRRDYKKKQALVKWKGYSDDFNSWISFKDLQIIYLTYMILTGKDFDLLRQRARVVYGAKNLDYSNRKNKKYVVTLKNGKMIHFGDSRYEDFTTHQDWKRRMRYRKRASEIKDKDGDFTYKDKNSANFWSYHLL